jgi:hypothetical protein
MRQLLTWLRNRIFRVRQFTARYPWMFFTLYQLSPINRKLMVTRNTRITIEGYPRSANTYAVYAFRHSNPDIGWNEIGHHLHVQAQILRSRDYGIPVILLIRHPLEAVRSLVVRHRFIPVHEALADYTRFYTDLLTLCDSFVIADFDAAINDVGGVTGQLNRRFGTTFNQFPDGDEQAKAAVFKEIDRRNRNMDKGRVTHLYRPDEGKEALKDAVNIDQESELFRKAEAIYRAYLQAR